MLMKSSVLAALSCLAAGCTFDGSNSITGILPDAVAVADSSPTIDSDTPDTDGPIVTSDASLCEWAYDPLFFDPCVLTFRPPPDLSAGVGLVVDTTLLQVRRGENVVDNLETILIEGETVAIWPLTSFTMDSVMELSGNLALLIAVDGGASISGEISGTERAGPGSRPAGSRDTVTCGLSGGGAGIDEAGGGSGGGGGGYGSVGAAGGDSNSDGNSKGTTDLMAGGGTAGEAAEVPGIRGGCDGGIGGAGQVPGNVAGGHGGGAVHIAVRGMLVVSGALSMGGQGGFGALSAATGGGGGGGSGGYIGLEGGVVVTSGVLAANGGGGGGGSSSAGPAGGNGRSGQSGFAVAGGGTPGGGSATGGGKGAVLGTAPATPIAPKAGSGGGGGGLGVIKLRAGALTIGGAVTPEAETSNL